MRRNNNKIYLLGRLDNQFIIGGQKIQAEELETIIESIETINCAYVIKCLEKLYRIICMVETSEDLSKSELKKLIATKLDQYSNYYNPSDIIKVLAIPRTQNGKLEMKQGLQNI